MTYQYPFIDATEDLKVAVWVKGQTIPDFDSNIWRHDMCGKVMKYAEHGMTTQYGWEIDHIYPRAKGGGDEIANLQPLFWQDNRTKGDIYPWSCS